MAIPTAAQLKAFETPEFTIDIGGGYEVLVRRPDFQLMVLNGLFPTPLLGEMVKMVGQWAGTDVNTLTEDVIKANDKVLSFVNTYACAALVSPRAVATEEERAALGGDAVLVTDLTLALRRRILTECTKPRSATEQRAATEVVAAAKTFPEDGSSAGIGSDVPPVPDATVISA